MTGANETIVDRVVARLRAQPLGDLITEEDLHDIVKQAIPRVFFQDRIERAGSGYHERTERKDPIIVEIMRDLLKDAARVAAESWVVENADVMAEYWKKVSDEGLLKYVQAIQEARATMQLRTGLGMLLAELNNERSRLNLPPIFLPPI